MVGRSMVRNMGIAAELGYLHVPDGVLVDVKRLDDLRDDQVVLICTGSQGEPMAALSRMANRDHRIDVGRAATPCSSRPRSSPATRTPSTASSTA